MPVPTVNITTSSASLRRADGKLRDERHVGVVVQDDRPPDPSAEDLAEGDPREVHEPGREHGPAVAVEASRDADADADDIVVEEAADQRLDEVRRPIGSESVRTLRSPDIAAVRADPRGAHVRAADVDADRHPAGRTVERGWLRHRAARSQAAAPPRTAWISLSLGTAELPEAPGALDRVRGETVLPERPPGDGPGRPAGQRGPELPEERRVVDAGREHRPRDVAERRRDGLAPLEGSRVLELHDLGAALPGDRRGLDDQLRRQRAVVVRGLVGAAGR